MAIAAVVSNVSNSQPQVEVVEPPEMSESEATEILQKIQYNLLEVGARLAAVKGLMKEMIAKRGYLALGYDTPRQMWEDKVRSKKSQFYRFLSMLEVEEELGIEFLSESHHRPLLQLPEGTGDRQKALERAFSISGSSDPASLTQGIVEQAVKEIGGGMPDIEEIKSEFRKYGMVIDEPSKKYKNAFKVVRYCLTYPAELHFQGAKDAWRFMQDPERWEPVKRAIAEMGEYNPSNVPQHCMSCIHSNLRHVEGEVFHYCAKRETQIHNSLGEQMAAKGCWINAHDAGAQARGEMERTQGEKVLVEIDGQKVEAIALHVAVKYVDPQTGEVRISNLPPNVLV